MRMAVRVAQRLSCVQSGTAMIWVFVRACKCTLPSQRQWCHVVPCLGKAWLQLVTSHSSFTGVSAAVKSSTPALHCACGCAGPEGEELARRLAQAWLANVHACWRRTGRMAEKHDAARPGRAGGGGEYEVQACLCA